MLIAPVCQVADRWPRPSRGAAVEHDEVVVPGALEQAGGAHRAFTVAAHHHGGLVGHVVGSVGEVAELDVHRAGQMPGEVLGVVGGCPGRGGRRAVGAGQRDAGGVVAGGGPRRHSAGEFADDVVVADLGGLPGDLVGVLVGVAHDDQRPVGGREPAQPGGEHRPQRDGDRPAHVARRRSRSTGRASMRTAPSANRARTSSTLSGASVGSRLQQRRADGG